MPRRVAENKLYPIVERWLRRRFKCFRTDTNKGLAHGRIDVIGVRDMLVCATWAAISPAQSRQSQSR
jgi:hypothetical protein